MCSVRLSKRSGVVLVLTYLLCIESFEWPFKYHWPIILHSTFVHLYLLHCPSDRNRDLTKPWNKEKGQMTLLSESPSSNTSGSAPDTAITANHETDPRDKRPKGPLSLTWVQWTREKFWKGTKNKRPKGPHNMHLSTMCHLLWWIGQGGNFYSLFGPKNTNLVEDIKILLPVKFRWILFSGFREKVKICLSQSEARAAILFFGSARKTQTW